MTTVAEVAAWNDAVTCTRVFALISLDLATLILLATHGKRSLDPYPAGLPKRLEVKRFPLDITLSHYMDHTRFNEAV